MRSSEFQFKLDFCSFFFFSFNFQRVLFIRSHFNSLNYWLLTKNFFDFLTPKKKTHEAVKFQLVSGESKSLCQNALRVTELSIFASISLQSVPGGNMHGHATFDHNSYAMPPPTYGMHRSKSKNSAMNALTLLAFLFFINVLQNCLREQMMSLNPTVCESRELHRWNCFQLWHAFAGDGDDSRLKSIEE